MRPAEKKLSCFLLLLSSSLSSSKPYPARKGYDRVTILSIGAFIFDIFPIEPMSDMEIAVLSGWTMPIGWCFALINCSGRVEH